LNEIFDKMENSLNQKHEEFNYCSRLLANTRTATSVIKSTGVGLSLASMIPGVGLALVAPRVVSSVAALVAIRSALTKWQEHDCKAGTTRDCDL